MIQRTNIALVVCGHARLDHPSLLESMGTHGHLFLRLVLLGLTRGLRFRFQLWFRFWLVIPHDVVGSESETLRETLVTT